MLKEAELDRFLDEFFDGTMPVQSEEKNTDESTEDLEEYTLPTDGLIIRQMKRDGKVSRRTWAALALMVIIVPVILYLSVRIFHGRRYMVCSLIVVVAAMLPFFMMFEGRKPKAREIMVISVLAAIGVAGRAAFFMLPSFQADRGNRDPYRSFLRRRSRISGRLHDHDDLEYFYGTWSMDTMADVCVWCDRIPGWYLLSEGNPESKKTGPLYLWFSECLSDLWRHHESCKYSDVLWIYNKRKSDCLLHFRCTGRPGARNLYRNFSLVYE